MNPEHEPWELLAAGILSLSPEVTYLEQCSVKHRAEDSRARGAILCGLDRKWASLTNLQEWSGDGHQGGQEEGGQGRKVAKWFSAMCRLPIFPIGPV